LWNWADAEKYYKRSIELNPNYATARQWYSRTLRNMARYEEAHEQIMLAKQADSLSLAISNNVGESMLERGDFAGAIEESRRGLEIGPSFVPYRTLAHSYLQLGQKEEALANARKAVELIEGSPIAGSPIALKVLGYVHGMIGNRNEALAIAHQIENRFAKGEADGRDVAIVYAGLGENDKVFEWLEKDFQNHNSSLTELQMEFPFKPLRSDPRFKDLVKRAGLTE
jgi:tetratricopeptide (TPR) repeat protein